MSEKEPASNRRLEEAVRAFLDELDPDPSRAGLEATPSRVAEAWRLFTSGYGVDIGAVVAEGMFDDAQDGVVLVRDIDFYSVCEHHLVPFFGRCHVAYIPAGRILGLSKIARIVDVFARRLQVQERMTRQIVEAIDTHVKPAGTAVVVEARHLCMMMRGFERHNADVVTSQLTGEFKTNASRAAEVFQMIGRPRG